ncbi:hypothetical protein O6B42_07285 [Campylobacter ureolyticus]|uniref:hypothetical protein n=1 Tax=Campylobacter ureolyticus TaxID=827 RepID=UPI0022B4E3C9|nr:hypothetical protein [Campylobacter ureolyticus]MCZ6133669.1 hypothetical protein [Campylobacter ureolyticus]
MNFTFDLNDKLDLANEIPSTLRAIAVLNNLLAKDKELDEKIKQEANFFLQNCLLDMSIAIQDYTSKKD